MARSSVAVTGTLGQNVRLPSWGRAFWQDPNDGDLIVLFASGNSEVDFSYSSDNGVSWTAPEVAFYVDDFDVHDNFDTAMDAAGSVHCAHRFASSGCYTILAKDFVNGGWTPSGVVGRGFVSVADTGVAKGFNGSIEISRTAIGITFFDVPGPFPVVRLVAKDSSEEIDNWWVPNPFTSFPILDSVGTAKSVFPAGQAGGYPIWAGSGPVNRQVIYSVDATGICQLGRTFGSWSIRVIPVKDPLSITQDPDTVEGSGYFSRIPLGPTMSFIETNAFVGPSGSRSVVPQKIIVLSNKHNVIRNFETLGVAGESKLTDGLEDSQAFVTNTLTRLESEADYTIDEDRSRTPLGIPYQSTLLGDLFSRGGASGTLVDLTWGSTDNTVNLYVLNNEPNGEQAISRTLVETTRPHPGGTVGGQTVNPQTAQYFFGSLTNAVSGIRSWAPAGREYTGGSGFLLTWNNFKALRHEARQYENVFKKREGVITQGSGLDGITRLVFWDFEESIEFQDQDIKLPTFVQQRTLNSGSNETFVGPSAAVGITSTDLDNLFDEAILTSGVISNGDSVTLEFTRPQMFHRFEVLWNDVTLSPTNSFFSINIEASQDGTNFTNVASIPERSTGFFSSGERLEKYSSEFDVQDVDLDGTINGRLSPFVGRYVRISFGGTPTGPEDVRAIRLYGAHNTAGGWRTEGTSKVFFRPAGVIFNRTENFATTREDELPTGWTTYGDFTWGVRASGSYSDFTQSGSVTEPSIFQGKTNGRDDGFAARTSRTGVPASGSTTTSGVLEVDITVDSSELAFDGTVGRTVSFDIRHDVVVNGPLVTLTDPQDDQVYFETVSSTGVQRVYYPARLPTDPNEYCGTNSCPDYVNFRTTVPTGNVTLRWVYQRGTRTRPQISNDETVVWIDNVLGVGALTQNAIAGFIQGSAFNTNTTTGPSGINAYMEKVVFDSGVFGYINSTTAAITGSLNAFLEGSMLATGSINAYMNAFLNEQVNAYVQGTTYNSQVNAYLANSGVPGTINAYLKNSIFESVNAFLQAPSGTTSSINAYMLTPEFLVVHGYIKGPLTINSGVNAFLQANGYQNNVNAYISGSIPPTGSINAYLLNEGAFSQINGYIARGMNSGVNAFIEGSMLASGVINAWTSGLGFASGSVNAYLMAVSGSPSGSINAYMAAVEVPTSNIHGVITGFGGDEQCNFPLPTVPTVTIPTGNFFT